MYFQAKSTLKSNLYYTSNQALKGKNQYLGMDSDL